SGKSYFGYESYTQNKCCVSCVQHHTLQITALLPKFVSPKGPLWIGLSRDCTTL
ncbi:13676_t:CDS:1, partial [Gigaspora rosea]